MKSLIYIFVFLLSNHFSNAKIYDKELLPFFDPNYITLEQLIERSEKLGDITIKNDSSEMHALKISAKRKYIFNDEKNLLGLFVVNELDGVSFPFRELFNDNDTLSVSGELKIGGFAHELNLVRCNALELFDAKVTSQNISRMSQIDSIKILGLPARGMSFDADLIFPNSLEYLIVRNSFLNIHFFKALSKLESLRKLTIVDCGIFLESPINAGMYYTSNTWGHYPRIFEEPSKRIVHLKVLDSDPSIFNHVIREEWKFLQNLEVDLHFSNARSINYVTVNDQFEFAGKFNNFPELKFFSFKEYSYKHRSLNKDFSGVTIESRSDH